MQTLEHTYRWSQNQNFCIHQSFHHFQKSNITFKDKLVQSEFKNESKRRQHCPALGSFSCSYSNVPTVSLWDERKSSLSLMGTFLNRPILWTVKPGVVVYLLVCECNAYYIGKTKQEFWRCMSQHLYSMWIGNRHLPVDRHAVLVHGYKVLKISFTALERVHIPDRGSDWNKTLLQLEQRWIFRLHATSYPGLNESISFAPFLRGFSSGKTH